MIAVRFDGGQATASNSESTDWWDMCNRDTDTLYYEERRRPALVGLPRLHGKGFYYARQFGHDEPLVEAENVGERPKLLSCCRCSLHLVPPP